MKHEPKKILVIQGHPLADSFCSALTDAYVRGAKEAGADVKERRLAKADFDPVLHKGYREIQALEPDLKAIQNDIVWAEHLVFSFPIWWGTPPALMKGFFDRTFVPGYAYKYASPKALFQKKLLSGRSARVICTMDSPPWYFRWLIGAPGLKMMKHSILTFCGVSPVRVSTFGSVKLSSQSKREKWLQRAEKLGRKLA
ncbi:MAG: NAD(P)H-dependent oxidoreductase [Lentisphaeria bacterium]|nr:NAD(P)H-dependent oxidoreductase [Lentisphaeria bacterium]